MSETVLNGDQAPAADVEMKEERVEETPLNSIQAPPDSTDPNPPPQVLPSSLSANTEHLSTIQPAPPSAPPHVVSATSNRPGSMPPQPSARPEKPVAHGGPTRQYLNSHVTPHLLEGVKYLAAYEPEKPLLWLADFLRERSKEVEGSAGAATNF